MTCIAGDTTFSSSTSAGTARATRHRLTMGRRERRDIRAVMNWAADAGFTQDRIGWLGYSMGASTLLMEAAQNPRHPGRRDGQSRMATCPMLLKHSAEQAQSSAKLVQPRNSLGGPVGLRRPDR